ncbi:TAF15 RNA polymerase II, TATA box binding protein (TBP)-associated factor (predicted), isoform CRA_b [Sciurus carolinensis]|uniref:TAF15 RNA polymerase II, TATA box binding protein (TBP)-associated factor (Predicted), isoform CRA_b n=1 Tax=Sciurus carolinensis TaxID=30640 RepID=A0AA41NIA6_SCICA|nr:TAF15 RNA polymerase II, TATA box binding protein (TBP)-associated factor (predicted), isoform CRA_b [Sciurus carolinensis]
MVETEVGVVIAGTEEVTMVETGEEAMADTKVTMEEIKSGGSMEENVVVVVEAMVETEVEATEETGVVHAMEETEVAVEAKLEEEMTTKMISTTDRADDCLNVSFSLT